MEGFCVFIWGLRKKGGLKQVSCEDVENTDSKGLSSSTTEEKDMTFVEDELLHVKLGCFIG